MVPGISTEQALLDEDGIRLQGSVGGIAHVTPRIDGYGLLLRPKDVVEGEGELSLPAVVIMWRLVVDGDQSGEKREACKDVRSIDMSDECLQVEVLGIHDWFRVTPRPPNVVVSGPGCLPDRLTGIVGTQCAVIDREGIRLHGSIAGVEHFTPRVDCFGLLLHPKGTVDFERDLVLPAAVVFWRGVAAESHE